jgi:hypothetical protein
VKAFLLTPLLIARYLFWLSLALVAGFGCFVLTVILVMFIKFKPRR